MSRRHNKNCPSRSVMTTIVPDEQVRRHTQTRNSPPAIVILSLPPKSFAFVWIAVALLRVLCTCFFFSAGQLYLALVSSPALEYYANFVTPMFATLYQPSAWIYIGFGVAHVYKLVQSLWMSFHSRALVFGNHRMISVFTDNYKCHQTPNRLSMSGQLKRLPVYLFFFDRQGIFGAESPYFHTIFLGREVFEMTSQTLQVYLASFLIGRPWINHLYVAVFFVNSCSTIIIEHTTAHKSPALERVLCLTADILLDSIMSIVLPVLIIGPYVLQFDTTTQSFPPTLLYSAVGFNRLVTESKQVLVYNWGDLIVKLIPHVSIYSCLNTIQSLICPDIKTTRKISSTPAKTQPKHRGPPAEILPHAPHAPRGPRQSFMMAAREMHFRSSLSERIFHMESRRLERRKAALVHCVFFLWGTTVLALHSSATYKAVHGSTVQAGCMQSIRPWLSSKFACSVYKFNCTEHDVTTPSADSLTFLDELSVAALIFSHCPALELPATIQLFPNLVGIDIWHSAISKWDNSSALSSKYHPNMVYLIFLETNMTELPIGVLQDLPPRLGDIEISHTNLTALPDDLDVRWPQVSTLFLEYSEFESWPPALSRMNIVDLSLIGNKLGLIPSMGNNEGGYAFLWMSNNPLEQIADGSGGLSELQVLALDDTNIRSFPLWIRDGPLMYAYNTPYCNSNSVNRTNPEVVCSDSNPQRKGRYPVDIVKANW